MNRYLLSALAVLISLTGPAFQNDTVRVKLRVLLVDKDLNQKPVPFYVVSFRNQSSSGNLRELKTDLDGKAESSLEPGRYLITTPKPVELGGKRFTWNLDIQIGSVEQRIDLTNDNAKIEDVVAAPPTSGAANASSAPASGDLSALFEKLKNAVVTVHAEAHMGSGFLVDSTGLVVTNNHVVQSSNYLAVQFDQKRKVPAKLITSNPDKDVAVLWFDPVAFREAVVAPLLDKEAASHVVVGQRVFTIGNPLGREKVLTTGVVSKVETDAITSDININPGNSGGPLFTLEGKVAGITTSGLRNLASIVPVENVRPLIEQARKQTTGSAPPSPSWLPVEPVELFPADFLRGMLQQEKFDTKPYFFVEGEFQIALVTPPVSFYLRHEAEMAAARKSAKRSSGDAKQAKPPANALEDAQDYRPVLIIRVRPKIGVLFKVRFKNGFVRMRLLCGGKEVAPVEPGRSEYQLLDQRARAVDTTFQGGYVYLADAVSPACGNVALEVYSEKSPETPLVKSIDPATVTRIWEDFEAFRKSQTVQAPATKP